MSLHAILDVDVTAAAGWPLADFALALLDGGAPLIQVRAKQLPSAPFLQLCDLIGNLAVPYGAAVIVNDRADLARMAGAAGAHVGQEDLAPSAARALVGVDAIVGCSTHTVQQIEEAAREPVDYIAIGPVFGTRTKTSGYDAVGLEMVTLAVRHARGLPVVAIGGITLETVPAVIAAGAAAVAVISDLFAGGDPSARVGAYLAAIRQV